MALMITDTLTEVSQGIALRRAAQQTPAGVWCIRWNGGRTSWR
ncbi:MAG TPA: hypothetical protein VI140_11625 [Oxalicibacterium sp.]